MPNDTNYYYGTSGSSTKASSSSYKPKRDTYSKDRILEYGRETNYRSERFYVDGQPSRDEGSMARKLSDWDKGYAKASRR